MNEVPPMSDDESSDDELSVAEADDLIRLLGNALDRRDPMPDHVVDGARAAFTWRTIDAELAEIVFDSTVESAGVRAEEIDRQITFQSPGVEIEVTVLDDSTRRLIGQLVPPAEMTVDVVASDRVITVSTDRLGRFGVDDLAPGPTRLVVRDPSGAPLVQTEWVVF